MAAATQRLRVSVLLFPGFELLDVAGPLEMFLMVESVLRDGEAVSLRREKGYELLMTAIDAQPGEPAPLVSARSNQGPSIVLDRSSIPPAESPHVLFVPGGLGTRKLYEAKPYLDKLRDASLKAKHTLTVCTGSALLSCTGLLDGRLATSNKRGWESVVKLNSKVSWQPSARWVVDGSYWTSSGVAAGMDMALAFVEYDFGLEVAEAVAKRIEYTWNKEAHNDPFQYRAKI